MRVVLYADDMEPITVIDLPEYAAEYLNERGFVRLAVRTPVQAVHSVSLPTFSAPKTVTVFSEWLVRRGQKHMMLFTRDEESALLLKCAFPPGQQAGLQELERQAFARGFLDALYRMGAA